MNTYPMLLGRQVHNDGCGRTSLDNLNRQFWQSRMTCAGSGAAEVPELTDIHALAVEIRLEVANDPR